MPDLNQQFGQNIPSPSDQMMDYSYLQNNQQIMNNGQSNISATMRIAQDNFHRDMNSVLQGTIAASMAIYNLGKSAVDKAKEAQYQDMLLGGGNYVLERGFMREAAWASGLAQSDLGRALKIGGRKPEFMDQQELEMQMQRSWHHRMQDLGVEVGGGVAAVSSNLLGIAAGKLINSTPWGIAAGFALDQTIGRAYNVLYAQPREYRNEFRKTSEVTNLNFSAGQRRLSEDVSNNLIDKFYEEERHPMARLVPIIGDAIANRLAPDTKASEFIPKMMQAGLFRDQNLGDVDQMEKFVKDTIKVVEKFAGLANTTKDAILAFKGNLRSKGLTDLEQNAALGNVTGTVLSTGLDFATVTNYNSVFQTLGYQSNLRKGIVAQSGLTELAQIKALQQAGLIDEEMDAGSLAFGNTQRAISHSKTGIGKVFTYGRGNIGQTAAYYAANGGDTATGFALEQGGFNKPAIDPNAQFAQNAQKIYDQYLEKGMSPQRALVATSIALGHDGSPESVAQIEKALFFDNLSQSLVSGSVAQTLKDRRGKNLQTTFNANNLQAGTSIFGNTGYYNALNANISKITLAKEFAGGSEQEYALTKFKNTYKDEIHNLYGVMGSNDLTKSESMKKVLADKLRKEGVAEEDIDRTINLALKEVDQYNARHYDSREVSNYHSLGKRLSEQESFILYDPRKLSSHEGVSRNSKAQKLFNELGSKFGKQFKSLYDKSELVTGFSGDDDSGVATSEVTTEMSTNEFLKSLKDAGANDQELEIIRKELSTPGGSTLGNMISNFVRNQKDLKSSDEIGFQNVFSALNKKDSKKYNNINEYRQKVSDFTKTIGYLKNMSADQVKTWFGKNKDHFLELSSTALGDDRSGKQLTDLIMTKAGSGDSAWSQVTKSNWFSGELNIATANEDIQKTLETENNPNTVAVNALAKACDRLATAIGG